MSDYASLKVPELKKLLQEKSLPVAGNKADLIARLQEHDKAGDSSKPGQYSFNIPPSCSRTFTGFATSVAIPQPFTLKLG
jgi:hypothetical protein